MTYNFRDDPTPAMPTEINVTGGVILASGTPQGDLITENFTGSSVSVSIIPPRGWALDSVVWSGGGGGTFSIPAQGVEETHSFTYTVSQNGTSLTNGGDFKIKNQGNGGSSGGGG
jgi:hypothetical protein